MRLALNILERGQPPHQQPGLPLVTTSIQVFNIIMKRGIEKIIRVQRIIVLHLGLAEGSCTEAVWMNQYATEVWFDKWLCS